MLHVNVGNVRGFAAVMSSTLAMFAVTETVVLADHVRDGRSIIGITVLKLGRPVGPGEDRAVEVVLSGC